MNKLGIPVLLLAVGLTAPVAQQSDYQGIKTEAEKYYAEGSYAKAYELYMKADALALPPAESRWVDFRLADTLWRSEAATQTADSTKSDEARQQLDALIGDIRRIEDRDRVRAEAQESLGDFYWTRRGSQNWGQAWNHYQQALDWWAASAAIEQARGRYLGMVWKMAKPSWAEPYYYYGYYGNYVPLDFLTNALKIARTEDDRAHAHYLIAMTLRSTGGDYAQRQRIPEELEAAIKAGKSTDWYDDALYYYAEWLSGYGRLTQQAGGQWRQEPDYVRALELYRRLLAEHVKGETRYYDQARQQIDTITGPVVSVSVSNIFLPDSEIQFHLNWRNVKRVELALYRVDLTRDVQFRDGNRGSNEWIQQIDVAGHEIVKSWFKDTGDKGDYRPGQETLRLDAELPLGAYLIEARSGTKTARDLVLVTDASLILKTAGQKALAYFCNALDGSPIPAARVRMLEKYYTGSEYAWRETVKETNQDGMALFEINTKASSCDLFAAAALDRRQALSAGNAHPYHSTAESWRIYVFTDRPAYRPNEKVLWKIVAREYNGSVYSTPSNQVVEFEVYDPRGSKVKEGKVTLNAFGSAWGSMELTESMPLGEYRISFWDQGRQHGAGNAVLFRLEEYKLPEFKVDIRTPEEDGKKKAFRLGEEVEVAIHAEYYFGGAVADASVELLVYQNAFYHWWRPPRQFPWFYDDIDSNPYRYGYGYGTIVKRETLKTDAEGKAVLTFETPRNTQQDYEYRIEARVTDASRREIIASDTVRVTRQRYYVYPTPQHYLYRPQDKVTVDIKALDANQQPAQIEGTVKVARDYWFEVWLDASGREVKGEALRKLQEASVFPPPVTDAQQKPWQLKFRGYQHDDIMTRKVNTNASGEGEFSFTPEREGYYRVAWSSEDKGSAPVTAETTVWVATTATTEMGYRHGGLEIIVDNDTFRTGQRAPVMLVAPANDRYVLFSVEGEDLYSYQLVHITGTVKLLELPVEERHVPNIYLAGMMIHDRQIFMDTKQVVVPPVRNFLKVEVKPDRNLYQPQEVGTLTVTTTDEDGKPVAAEVGLGLVDESVYYIQQDYAGDPRQFYYGTKRQQRVQNLSTFQWKTYARLVEGPNQVLMDERKRDLGYAGREESGEMANRAEGGGRVAGEAVAGLGKKEAQIADQIAASAPALAEANAMKPKKAQSLGEGPAVQVRADFRATVFWQPDVVTGKDGKAVVKVEYPDSLTAWKATARAAAQGNQFGIATAATRTRLPLIVRLQAPRFFVAGDTVTVSAVVNNNTDEPMNVATALESDGLAPAGTVLKPGETVVPANGEARVDWLLSAPKAGTARLKVTGRSTTYADAMEKTYPIYEHGIEKFVARSGKVRGGDITVKLEIPKDRKPESTRLSVQVTPSMAVTMLDALPYLISYPYGCTEQTMSRFLPTVITVDTLKDLGMSPEQAMSKVFGGIEPDYANKTHRDGKKDLPKMQEMAQAGLKRLYDFQHSDGGWGWWKEGESDHFMTAYVAWGLTLAGGSGVEIRSDVLERAVGFLQKELVEEEESYDVQAWMLHALATYHAQQQRRAQGSFEAKAFDNLWANRDRLNAYTRALLALSAAGYGHADRAMALIRNLENGVKIDTTPDTSVIVERGQQSGEGIIGTAHWGEDGIYWRWSDGGVEATAFALRALLAVDPQNKLVEPVVNWLIKNRRGAQWSNTRDTAITVLALNDYLRGSGELAGGVEYELLVNGHSIASRKVTAQEVLAAPSLFDIDREYIRDGTNEIRIRRKSGSGPIYFAVQSAFFSLEEPVTPAGNEIFVRRQYYRLAGKPTLLKGYAYERLPLGDGETVVSGERVETVITIEAKNNYEYLVFEDLKPAGFEAVEVRSGETIYAQELKSGAVERKYAKGVGSGTQEPADLTGRSRWVYQELRDRKVVLFIDKLPQGFWEIRYTLRAETPGKFHALPVLGHAMYVPEIRCNGSEIRVSVVDKE